MDAFFPAANPGTVVICSFPNSSPPPGYIRRAATAGEQSSIMSGEWWYDPATGILSKPPVKVPKEIAHWRARAVLGFAGLLESVEQELAIMQGSAGVVARAAWDGRSPLARNGATVVMLAAKLGLTDSQVDDMFRQAAELQV